MWFVSDEHLTFAPSEPLRVGDRVRVVPAHVDPTVTLHERLHVVRGDEVSTPGRSTCAAGSAEHPTRDHSFPGS